MLILLFFALTACKDNAKQDLSKYRTMYAKPISEWAKPNIDESVKDKWQEFAPIPRAQAPKDNEFVHTKAHLGRNLFNEPRLSKSGQIAFDTAFKS